MRRGPAARRPAGWIRQALASLLCLAAAASVASAAHAHAEPGGAAPAWVAAPAGLPCAGELAHDGGAAPTGAHCRTCQELSQARAALPRCAVVVAAPGAQRAAETAGRLALVAQRAAAAHPSRAPPRG